MKRAAAEAALILKAGRERSLAQRHPWVFSGAIAAQSGTFALGDVVRILAADGKFLAYAYVNPNSQIAARVLTFDDIPVEEAFFRAALQRAFDLRARLPELADTDACRLVAAEADGLPGLIVDRYGDVLVMQVLTAGMERLREDLARWLLEMTGARALVERSDVDVRKKEGLPERVAVLHGDVGDGMVCIREHGRAFWVDVLRGHKTGFYLDQRESRRHVASRAADAEVLNVFSYTGGFGVYAATAGARRVLHLDASADALALAQRNMRENGVNADDTTLQGDAFVLLRKFRDEGRRFDVVVLDPPKFVHSKGQLDRACRGYKDINWLGFQLLRPGGTLYTFSCSGLLSTDLFQKVVFGAALDAGVSARVVARLGQAADHPFALAFPEGEYLKGLAACVG